MAKNGNGFLHVLEEAEEEFSSVMEDLEHQLDAIVTAAQNVESESTEVEGS